MPNNEPARDTLTWQVSYCRHAVGFSVCESHDQTIEAILEPADARRLAQALWRAASLSEALAEAPEELQHTAGRA